VQRVAIFSRRRVCATCHVSRTVAAPFDDPVQHFRRPGTIRAIDALAASRHDAGGFVLYSVHLVVGVAMWAPVL